MAQTHGVSADGDHIVKRYTRHDRGEPVREWRVLLAVSQRLPDLVPRPLDADLHATPPWIKMSRLPGTPLAGRLTGTQLDALYITLRKVWSVPVGEMPPRRFHPQQARSVISAGLRRAERPAGRAGRAYDLCLAHLAQPLQLSGPAVLGHGDANLANYLWDGRCVRMVDFEDAGVSTIEYELAFLVEHLSGHDTDWTPFLRRFAVDEEQLRAARLTAAAHWLLLLLPGGPAETRNPPGTLDRQAGHLLDLIDATRPIGSA